MTIIKTTKKFWNSLKGVKIKQVKILEDESEKGENCTAFLILDNKLIMHLCNEQYYPFIEVMDKEEFKKWDKAFEKADKEKGLRKLNKNKPKER